MIKVIWTSKDGQERDSQHETATSAEQMISLLKSFGIEASIAPTAMTQEEKLAQALQDFCTAFKNLNEQWASMERSPSEYLSDAYPFERSFDEYDVVTWADANAKIVTSDKWYVLTVHTNNGDRIGISQEIDGELLEICPDDDAANESAKKWADLLGVPEFDNDIDYLA